MSGRNPVQRCAAKLSPAHLMSFIQARLTPVVNRRFEAKCRRRILNKDFSIICSTCIGGVIYHRLGMQFLSPTVNLWLDQKDFVRMIRNLPEYMEKELQFINTDWNFPVGLLGDVRIMFNHATSEREAAEEWNRRKGRIHYENLYIILYDRDGLTEEDLQSLTEISCKRLVVLSERTYPHIPYVKTIQKPKKSRPNDCTFMDRDGFDMRTFEKQFDFVAWLNGENLY